MIRLLGSRLQAGYGKWLWHFLVSLCLVHADSLKSKMGLARADKYGQ
jgi:hypothetical protein